MSMRVWRGRHGVAVISVTTRRMRVAMSHEAAMGGDAAVTGARLVRLRRTVGVWMSGGTAAMRVTCARPAPMMMRMGATLKMRGHEGVRAMVAVASGRSGAGTKATRSTRLTRCVCMVYAAVVVAVAKHGSPRIGKPFPEACPFALLLAHSVSPFEEGSCLVGSLCLWRCFRGDVGICSVRLQSHCVECRRR